VPSIMSSSPPESIGAASVEGTSPLRPPVNFGTVEAGHIYRSGYPQVDNFGYLKSLGLKTILSEPPAYHPIPFYAFEAS
jgi:tyrosine-protein phosphatase SIW14